MFGWSELARIQICLVADRFEHSSIMGISRALADLMIGDLSTCLVTLHLAAK